AASPSLQSCACWRRYANNKQKIVGLNMKSIGLVFLIALASCATQPSDQSGDTEYEPIRLQLMSDLDDPKYTSIQVSDAEADEAVCASEGTLTCLDITR